MRLGNALVSGVVAGVSRADLLRRGGRSGVALLLAGPALAVAPAKARAATPDNDLAYARLFVACELLAGDLKALAARIAASEAQHLSVFAGEAGGERIGPAFPRPLTIDQASDQLDRFTA